MPLYSLKWTQQRRTKIFWLNVMNRCREKSNLMDDNTDGCRCRPCPLTRKVAFSPRSRASLSGPSVAPRQRRLNVCAAAFISAPISMCLPCASYLEGLFKAGASLNTQAPRGCSKPKLQSRHCCTHSSCTTCSDWSSNSHLGICSRLSVDWMEHAYVANPAPLQGLCSTWVRAWMSPPWHLSMAVHFFYFFFNVSTKGSNCRQAWPDWQYTPQHTYTFIPRWAHTHIHAHFTLRGAIMTVLMVSAIKGRRISHEGQQIWTSQTQAC